MSSGELSPDVQPSETETSHGTIEAKEIISVLAEMRDREQDVAEIIEDALNMPIPDLEDQPAVDEFNHRMAIIKELIPIYISRSELLLEMQKRVDGKINKANQKYQIS